MLLPFHSAQAAGIAKLQGIMTRNGPVRIGPNAAEKAIRNRFHKRARWLKQRPNPPVSP